MKVSHVGVGTEMTKKTLKIFMAGVIQSLSSGFWLPLIYLFDCKSFFYFSSAPLNYGFITIKADLFAH